MGRITTEALVQAGEEYEIELSRLLAIHLWTNHYPPVPPEMVPVALEAIQNYNDECGDVQIILPEGVTWRGQAEVPTLAVIGNFHLDPWLDSEER